MKPEDIGLEKKDLSDQLISLGHKRLLPKEALAALAVIKGRAYALVEANTFAFLNGLAHFLPNSTLAEVTEKLEELETEFWEAKKAFLEKYASLKRQNHQQQKENDKDIDVSAARTAEQPRSGTTSWGSCHPQTTAGATLPSFAWPVTACRPWARSTSSEPANTLTVRPTCLK
jgi:hypothetical protein